MIGMITAGIVMMNELTNEFSMLLACSASP